MFRRSGAVALLALAVTIGPALPASAAGSTLHCGDQVSTDIVLRRDLNCAGDGLHLVIAEGQTLTIDLNGRRIKGDGTGTALETEFFAPGRYAGNLVVKNGTISGFDSAVVGPAAAFPGLTNLTFTRMRLAGNGSWQPRRVRRATVVENSTVIDSGSGGAYTDGSAVTVRDSEFVRSSVDSASESYNYLYNSKFTEGGFSGGSASTVIAVENTFRRCDTGIVMRGSWIDPMRIEGNTFRDCKTGLRLDGMLGSVSVRGNSFIGNRVVGMTYMNDLNRELQIVGNLFYRNTGDGLTGVDAQSDPTIGRTQISGNTAIGNGGLGINVTGGVKDGGDNLARRNGNRAQCSGVACH